MAAVTAVLLAQQASNPVRPAIATLTDDFATQDTAKWFFGTGASVSAGQLVEVCAPWSETVSLNSYDLTGSTAVIQLVQRANVGNGTTFTYFVVYITAGGLHGSNASFEVNGTTLRAYRTEAGVETTTATVTYSSTDHQWLRMRESAGTIFWDTSPDAATWTNIGSWARTFEVTAMSALFGTGYTGTETAPGSAIWDNFNAAPPVTHTGTATATASASGATTTVRTKTGAAAAAASATAANSSTRTKMGTASAAATATRTGVSVRTKTGTATASAAASGTTTATRPKTGTATGTATASGVTASQRVKTGTATATATATRTTTSTRVKTGTAQATATATGTTSSSFAEIHTTTGTAAATATAGGTATSVKRPAGTATLLAGATALTTTWRTAAGTALAHATAIGTTGQSSAPGAAINAGPLETLTVGVELRVATIGAELRTLEVGGESRRFPVTPDQRTDTVPAATRDLATVGS